MGFLRAFASLILRKSSLGSVGVLLRYFESTSPYFLQQTGDYVQKGLVMEWVQPLFATDFIHIIGC